MKKNIKKQAKSEKRNNKSLLTLAVRRVIKDRELFNDFAMLADYYSSPLTC